MSDYWDADKLKVLLEHVEKSMQRKCSLCGQMGILDDRKICKRCRKDINTLIKDRSFKKILKKYIKALRLKERDE